MRLRRLLLALRLSALLGGAALLSQCAAPSRPAPAPGAAYASDAAAAKSRASAESAAAPLALAPCAPPEPAPRRSGLATRWGGRLEDRVSTTAFQRTPGPPLAVDRLHYNDRDGAMAMAASGWTWAASSLRDHPGRLFRFGLVDRRGRPLQAIAADPLLICLGEPDQRYAIVIENLSDSRLECVLTVDGLDVLTGKPGRTAARGHVLNPGERRLVKGWRTSRDAVAAFRFGSVDDSYAAATGNDANVGVVGCAVFSEKGTRPAPWKHLTEADQRRDADPFIAAPDTDGFAVPPP